MTLFQKLFCPDLETLLHFKQSGTDTLKVDFIKIHYSLIFGFLIFLKLCSILLGTKQGTNFIHDIKKFGLENTSKNQSWYRIKGNARRGTYFKKKTTTHVTNQG